MTSIPGVSSPSSSSKPTSSFFESYTPKSVRYVRRTFSVVRPANLPPGSRKVFWTIPDGGGMIFSVDICAYKVRLLTRLGRGHFNLWLIARIFILVICVEQDHLVAMWRWTCFNFDWLTWQGDRTWRHRFHRPTLFDLLPNFPRHLNLSITFVFSQRTITNALITARRRRPHRLDSLKVLIGAFIKIAKPRRMSPIWCRNYNPMLDVFYLHKLWTKSMILCEDDAEGYLLHPNSSQAL